MDPLLGRFISPDSIVPDPGNPQSLNRFSYVLDDPVGLADPSGQCGLSTGTFDSQYDCTLKDFQGASIAQRTSWFNGLTADMDKKVHTDLSGSSPSSWFNNIKGVLKAFNETNQDTSDWVREGDAGILITIQNGYAGHLSGKDFGTTSSGASPDAQANQDWKDFFDNLQNNGAPKDLIANWGTAEAAGTAYGQSIAAGEGFFPNSSEQVFLNFGNVYRWTEGTVCRNINCAGTPLDPRYGNAPVYYVTKAILHRNPAPGIDYPQNFAMSPYNRIGAIMQ